MQQSFDIVRELGCLDSTDAAWRFIRGFAAEWATPISESDGFTEAELDAAEKRLGVRLPAAVRDAYRLFGHRSDLTSENGTLWSPSELHYDQSNQMIVFRAAHQAVAFFGVSVADPACDDPPTFMYATCEDPAQESWEPFLTRFSLACVDMVLWESVEAGRCSDGRDETDDDAATLPEVLTEVPFPRYPGSRWYASADIILRHDIGAWVAVSGRSADALEAFREAHPGYWVDE
jgi:hypothetical protein